MKDRLFSLFFACTVIGTFTFGFQVGKRLQYITTEQVTQINRVVKSDRLAQTTVAKNP